MRVYRLVRLHLQRLHLRETSPQAHCDLPQELLAGRYNGFRKLPGQLA